jgi:hypothetical protein
VEKFTNGTVAKNFHISTSNFCGIPHSTDQHSPIEKHLRRFASDSLVQDTFFRYCDWLSRGENNKQKNDGRNA